MSVATSPLTRRAALALLATLGAALGAACGGKTAGGDSSAATAQGSASAAPGGKKTFTIAMIAKSSTNPVFLSGRQGAEAAAAELTKSQGVEVKIDWLTPPNEDAAVQAQRIAQAVNGGDDAILFSASEAAKVVSAIDDAVGRGVPVMTFDSDVPT
ncbi:MAG: substrate-binding domain-containing protein, partial [Gemmatirosa sp.]|nr:substrate-binding domain-containing protein [Gemmatirosa sp.]